MGGFCAERGILLPISFDAAEILMKVQSIERTFIDKVFAVCDYKIKNMQDRNSRHLYDICKLLGQVELNQQINIPKILKEIIRSRFYESDYKNITQKLLYEDISYDYAIENGIVKIAETDIFEYKQ